MPQRGDVEDTGSLAAVGAVVGHDSDRLRLDETVVRKAHLHGDLHRNAGSASRNELLLAGVDQLDGTPSRAREDRGDERVVVVAALASEPTPDVRLDDADVALSHVEGPGDPASGHERRLRVHPERQLPAWPIVGDAADRLDRCVPLWLTDEDVLDDDVALREPMLDVTALDVDLHGDIVYAVVVDERCARQHRGLRVEDRVDLLVLHLDQAGGVARGLEILCGDRGDFLSDVAHLVDGKDRHVADEGAPRLPRVCPRR